MVEVVDVVAVKFLDVVAVKLLNVVAEMDVVHHTSAQVIIFYYY